MINITLPRATGPRSVETEPRCVILATCTTVTMACDVVAKAEG